MAQVSAPLERLIGRAAEARHLQAALHDRRSQLIWGPPDSGKTFLISNVLAELPLCERRKCLCWAGPASRRQLVEHFVRGLFLAGDPSVRKKVQADGCDELTRSRWIARQSALRLRGILFTAAEQGDYHFFLDHLTPVSHAFAELLKEIMYHTKTPVYIAGHGYSQAEIGYAWSLYWTDEYRLHLGSLPEMAARDLLERCIETFSLRSLNPNGFREEILRLSGNLPGAIVKMCAMAATPRYRYGDRVKLKLLHMDYLLQTNRIFSACHP
jgi:hypothetical protein